MAEIGYKHIICDPTLCTGCRICEYACSMTKTRTYDPAFSRIRVVRIEPITMTAISCRMCADAPCVLACPRDALAHVALALSLYGLYERALVSCRLWPARASTAPPLDKNAGLTGVGDDQSE